MPVIIYAPTERVERNLKQILDRLFSNCVHYQDLRDNHQHLATLNRPPHIDVRIQGIIRLFEFNNPQQHFSSVVASVASAIQQYHWEAHTEKVGEILQAIDSSSSEVLVYLSAGHFSVTRFRPHPHPHMRTRGLLIATGPGLPTGGIVRVGAGNELYSRLYGHAGRQLMRAGDEALINGIINLGVNVGTGMVLARLLGATGLISQADAGALWRGFSLLRQGGAVATARQR
ncbi:lipocalin-like domain-containing protein [Roseibium sp. LAB1]